MFACSQLVRPNHAWAHANGRASSAGVCASHASHGFSHDNGVGCKGSTMTFRRHAAAEASTSTKALRH